MRRERAHHVSRNAGPAVTLVLVFALAMTLLGPSASGHSGLVRTRWPAQKTVKYGFTQSTNSMPAKSRERINLGAKDWNRLNGSIRLVPGTTIANYSTDTCPLNNQSGIHYRRIDGPNNILALGGYCTQSGNIVSMRVIFDSSESWYTGTGTPPANKIDLWAVATHELGHTIGITHFDSNDSVCANNVRETMCPFYSLSQRRPADHDRHGFAAVYGGG